MVESTIEPGDLKRVTGAHFSGDHLPHELTMAVLIK
jgi:hypothetical protein